MILVRYCHNSERLPKEIFRKALAALPENMMREIERYRRWQDRQMVLAGKLLLMECLREGYGNDNGIRRLMKDRYGRPHIPGCGDFNISHSGGLTVCCLSEHGKVGVDVEAIQKVNAADFSQQLSKKEMAGIKSAEDFFRLWTEKEAALKADGRGLSIDMKSVTINGPKAFIGDKEWHMKPLDLHEGYICHIAFEVAGQEIVWEERDIFGRENRKPEPVAI